MAHTIVYIIFHIFGLFLFLGFLCESKQTRKQFIEIETYKIMTNINVLVFIGYSLVSSIYLKKNTLENKIDRIYKYIYIAETKRNTSLS